MDTSARGSTVRTSSVLKSVGILITVFLTSLLCLGLMFYSFPPLDQGDRDKFRLPWSLDDAKALGQVLSKLKDTHFTAVLGTMALSYVFLQTFAIPGSISLTILSGYLFPFPVALLLVCLCSATGATLCYLLSSLMGEGVLLHYFPQRLSTWRAQVDSHKHDMFWYILFLRITPFLPNWFINLAAPIVGVQVAPFYWGTFFGVGPPSFFFVRAGTTLYELTTTTGHISWASVIVLALLACLSLTPVLLRRCLRNKVE